MVLTAPFASSHSATTITVPGAVGVRRIGTATPPAVGAIPVGPVMPVDAENVPSPVLPAPLENRMVWFTTPVFAGAELTAVAVKVTSCVEVVVALGVSVKVDPLMMIGIAADLVPAEAVTVAVRLLKSAVPFFSTTVASPFEFVGEETLLNSPLVDVNVTATPANALRLASTTVAVTVAEAEPSVGIVTLLVPTESPLGVSVEPLSVMVIVLVFPPAVAVTVAVRLLKFAVPFFRMTVASPVALVGEVGDTNKPVSVLKLTGMPAIARLEESTTVAVMVAVVLPSVLIVVNVVPSDSPATVGVVVVGVVVDPAVPPPPPHATN